jgi:hypothetical protein
VASGDGSEGGERVKGPFEGRSSKEESKCNVQQGSLRRFVRILSRSVQIKGFSSSILGLSAEESMMCDESGERADVFQCSSEGVSPAYFQYYLPSNRLRAFAIPATSILSCNTIPIGCTQPNIGRSSRTSASCTKKAPILHTIRTSTSTYKRYSRAMAGYKRIPVLAALS